MGLPLFVELLGLGEALDLFECLHEVLLDGGGFLGPCLLWVLEHLLAWLVLLCLLEDLLSA